METKLREVRIEEYWPLIVKNTDEFQQIAVAENPEFNKLAECIYRVLEDGFLADATEYGVERWESILKLTPAETDTLDDRKARILTQLSVKIPYTWRVLKQMLTDYIGEGFVMEYVNDEGKLVIHTDRIADDKLATIQDLLERVLPQNIEVVQVNHHIGLPWWENINKYAECEYIYQLSQVNADYKKDLTSDGEWVYPLPKLKQTNTGWGKGLFTGSPVKKFDIELPAITGGTGCLIAYANELEECRINLPNATSLEDLLMCAPKLTHVEVIAPKATNAYTMVSGYWPSPNIKHFRLHAPNLSNCYRMLEGTQIDVASVWSIVETIPTWDSGTHRLTLGIHIDHQNDEEVLAAIANAKAKGWTVTVQWNGTRTSTASTMSFGQLIYAKVGEIERPDGTTERVLDWGHYVTDSTGYETFRSLESAYKYFNLEMPEND